MRVILEVKLKLYAAESVHLVNGDLHCGFNSLAVDSGGAGNGADAADFDRFICGKCGRAAQCEYGHHHCDGENHRQNLFHSRLLLDFIF